MSCCHFIPPDRSNEIKAAIVVESIAKQIKEEKNNSNEREQQTWLERTEKEQLERKLRSFHKTFHMSVKCDAGGVKGAIGQTTARANESFVEAQGAYRSNQFHFAAEMAA